MKISKLENTLVNRTAKRNIKIAERLFIQIDLSNVKKALEVGCGIGVVASYLAEKYKWNVTGIDLDPEQIETAKNNYEENEYLKFLKADVAELPFGNSEYDMVLSFDVLHHIPDYDKAIEEIDRVLRPKGFYILSDLALPRCTARIFKNLGVFGMDDIINRLKRYKFEVVYEEKPKIKIPTMTHFSIVSQKY